MSVIPEWHGGTPEVPAPDWGGVRGPVPREPVSRETPPVEPAIRPAPRGTPPQRPVTGAAHSAVSQGAVYHEAERLPNSHGAPSPDTGWTPIADEAARATRVQHPTGQWPKPTRRRVLAVANQKGGVGKTTSTVNIAAAMALRGLRVLVVDLDPQGNASTALGVDHRSGAPSVYEVLLGEIGLADALAVSPQSPNLLCVPATIDLAGSEIELVTMAGRESRLKQALPDAVLQGLNVDFVFIDCPPSLGLLTVNALVAAPEVLIPIQCEYYALEGLGQLLHNIELVRSHLNRELTVSTILLTMYDGRTKLADQVTTEVRNHFGDQVLRTIIPRSVKISEAPGFGQTVLVYDPGSRGAMCYLDAAREIVQRAHQPGGEVLR